MSFEYEYEKASHTVDIAVFRLSANVVGKTQDYIAFPLTGEVLIKPQIKHKIETLLIERKNDPFKGKWCLPGGFINMDETLKEAAVRELKEETEIEIPEGYLHSVGTYDAVNRDERSRVITNAFWSFSREEPTAGDDAKEAVWFDFDMIHDNLGFDHYQILKDSYSLFCQTLNIRE